MNGQLDSLHYFSPTLKLSTHTRNLYDKETLFSNFLTLEFVIFHLRPETQNSFEMTNTPKHELKLI